MTVGKEEDNLKTGAGTPVFFVFWPEI